jgi:hypothetical protein
MEIARHCGPGHQGSVGSVLPALAATLFVCVCVFCATSMSSLRCKYFFFFSISFHTGNRCILTFAFVFTLGGDHPSNPEIRRTRIDALLSVSESILLGYCASLCFDLIGKSSTPSAVG